jgi:hypothetical protein
MHAISVLEPEDREPLSTFLSHFMMDRQMTGVGG